MKTPQTPDYATPETDALIAARSGFGPTDFEWRTHARRLERELNTLRWIPISERLPTIEDGNEFEDVEWSDGRDIWQGNYKNSRRHNPTHWRRITLP